MSMFCFLRKKESRGGIEYIIAGLGNPGREYDGTRHNAGFEVIGRIAEKCGVEIKRAKFDALCADTMIAGHRVLLRKPQTYMNLSGKAVKSASDFYKIPPERIIVVCDDVNLDVGRIRIRRRGSDGGQKGLKDIIVQMGDGFPRIRVGVGRPPETDGMVSWVLGHIPENLKKEFSESVVNAAGAAECVIEHGVDDAMNRFNR